LSVLQAVLGTGHIWLAVLAVFFSLVGAYYYLRVIKVMYFDEPVSTEKIVAGMDMRVVLSLNGVAVVALGLMPGALMTACETAVGLSLRAFVRTLY
jgi:NADH-quinone oxidoreductase subunit N